MSTIDNATLASVLGKSAGTSASSASSSSASGSSEVSQQNFLTLLTAQLKNQDPTKPMDNSQFVSQLAQISTVSGIQGLQTSIEALSSSLTSNQTLQAANLVGHQVLVAGGQAYKSADGQMQGAVQNSASGAVKVGIYNAGGELVKSLDLGTQASGLVNFSWDGSTDSGDTAAAGTYTIKATVTGSDGKATALTTYGAAPVAGVEVANNTVTLDLTGLSAVSLSGVRQILQ